MLEQAGSMFDDMEWMLRRIKKRVYRQRMDYFREKNAQLLSEMTGFVEQAENQKQVEDQDQTRKRKEAAEQVAKAFADAVEARFAKKGKISGRSQMEINLMMIYFVFPAILLTESDCAVSLADAIRDEWRGRFRDSAQLDYSTYEKLSTSFKEELFGIPRVLGILPRV